MNGEAMNRLDCVPGYHSVIIRMSSKIQENLSDLFTIVFMACMVFRPGKIFVDSVVKFV